MGEERRNTNNIPFLSTGSEQPSDFTIETSETVQGVTASS